MKLRPYQGDALNALFNYFKTHPDPKDNPLVAMPTGTGKAVVIGGFVKYVMTTWPGQRILMLVHSQELVGQNADKAKQMWSQVPLGIYSAGLGSKTHHMPVTFGGIQSVVKNLTAFGPMDVVLIDECHLIPTEEETDYQKAIAYFRARNPRVRFVGLSATIFRLGLGLLTEGGLFTDVCYDLCSLDMFNQLIADGYLCPLIPMPTNTVIDLKGVKTTAGDFNDKQLQAAVNKQEITMAAVAEGVEKSKDRDHWLIFATGIDHAKEIIKELRDVHGISAEGIWSKGMTKEERTKNLTGFMEGKFRALVNVNILTTGFDFPGLDCMWLLRPTKSPVLHVQMLGRGTRPFFEDGFGFDLETIIGRLSAIAASVKQNCLVLDYAGNTMRLGPINDPKIPKKKGSGTGDIPIKVCNECGCMNHISARFCVNCGAEFSFEVKITAKASSAKLIANYEEPITALFDVNRVEYDIHVRPFRVPSLKVSYFSGVRRFVEWVCLEHHGSNVIYMARRWWSLRTDVIPPHSIAEAMQHVGSLRVPKQLRVWVNRKDPKIMDHLFEEVPNVE